MVDLFTLGFKKNNLYEVLATTWEEEKKTRKMKPNTACMGIRVLDENLVSIGPYPTTTTYKNLKENGQIILNLINDIELFAIAALKNQDATNPKLREFPPTVYDFFLPSTVQEQLPDNKDLNIKKLPFISDSWGILLGEVQNQTKVLKKNGLGKIEITKLQLKIIYTKKLKESYDLINRAQNLALETIILATRMKIAKENSDHSKLNILKKKTRDNIQNVQRFSNNVKAFKAIEYVKDYLAFYEIDL